MKTFFNKLAQPSNLLTVPDYRVFSKALGLASWRSGLRHYAKKKGGAFVIRANGDLFVLTRGRNGQLRQRTYPNGKWGWETKQTVIA